MTCRAKSLMDESEGRRQGEIRSFSDHERPIACYLYLHYCRDYKLLQILAKQEKLLNPLYALERLLPSMFPTSRLQWSPQPQGALPLREKVRWQRHSGSEQSRSSLVRPQATGPSLHLPGALLP